jgi:hypothetical protein
MYRALTGTQHKPQWPTFEKLELNFRKTRPAAISGK